MRKYDPSRIQTKNAGAGAQDLEVKGLVAQLGEAFEAFKAKHEEEIKEVKKGKEDVLTKDSLSRIDTALEQLEAKMIEAGKKHDERADELEASFNRKGLASDGEGVDIEAEVKSFNNLRFRNLQNVKSDISVDEYQEYKKTFLEVIVKGDGSLTEAQRKTMISGSDPDGGYLVPTGISSRIITKLRETSPMRQYANIETISSDALEGMNDLDEASIGGWVTEQGSRSVSDTPQVGKWRIPVEEMYAQPKVTQRLLDDAAVNIEMWLGDKVADIMTRTENAAFITGDGVGKPRGITTYSTVSTADDTRSWGVFQHVVTGADGALATSDPVNVFYDLEAALRPGYLPNSRIFTRRSVKTLLRKVTDENGQYMWQPSLIAGQPSTFLGYAIVGFEDMPTIATNSLSLALGDMRETYTIVDRQGFRVIRDNLTDKPYIKFYTTRRVGGAALNFESLKFLKFSAS